LFQANGRGWSFQLSIKAPQAASSSTEIKDPRRMARRMMTEKKYSTRLIHVQPVGEVQGDPLLTGLTLTAQEPVGDLARVPHDGGALVDVRNQPGGGEFPVAGD
jgi:hypothetical protein